jgi:arsenate reductase (thioredoxin)
MKTVLFACVHNAGRSQMAAAFFNRLADPARARAISAGTAPAGQVHPEVVETMRELGIELRDAVPRRLTEDVARRAHVLVTMGCGETCPVAPGATTIEWELEDPKGRSLGDVRAIRDRIQALVTELIDTEGLR